MGRQLNKLSRMALAFITMLLIQLFPSAMSAYDFWADGFYFNRNADGKSVSLTYRYMAGVDDSAIGGELVVPSTVTNDGVEYTVTVVGGSAFAGCSRITGVTLPNTITFIGSSAFSSCKGLVNVNIPNSVKSIGSYAFQSCVKLSDIVIPNSVTSIGDGAFRLCSGLTSISIPNSVISFGTDVFEQCSNINLIETDNENATCKTLFAASASSIKTIKIGDSMSKIEDDAFNRCSSLENLTLGKALISIGETAFCNCRKLESISIPSSVEFIDKSAFRYCEGLKSIVVDAGNRFYDSRDGCNALIETSTNNLIIGCENTIIPSTVTTIGDYAFYGCKGLTSVTIPRSVTSIGNAAFDQCTGLTSVVWDTDHIGDFENYRYSTQHASPFYDLMYLKTITFGSNVKRIPAYICYGMTSVAEVKVADSITSVGNCAFDETTWYNNQPDGIVYAGNVAYKYKGTINTPNVTIKDGALGIGDYAFAYHDDLYGIELPNSVISIGEYAFASCHNLSNVRLPNRLNTIGNYAFLECRGLTQLDIPNLVTSIGECAFSLCEKLQSVSLPNAITEISSYLFDSCTSLSDITIPSSVKEIGRGAFRNCLHLQSITIPNSVVLINESAFEACTALDDITVPESVVSMGGFAFYGTSWYDKQPDGLIYLGRIACCYKGDMPEGTVITLNEGTVAIAGYAFVNCPGLTGIIMPNSLIEIGNYAFGQSQITSVVFGDSIKRIGACAFSQCDGLTSISIPNSTEEIGSNAFANCRRLEEITIGKSVKQIEYWAFSNDNALKNVNSLITNPNAVTLGESVFFRSSTSTCTLHVPYGTRDTYENLDQWKEFAVINEMDADNKLLVVDSDVLIGETKSLPVEMINTTDITALQVDIMLPDGLSIVKDYGEYKIDLNTNRATRSHSLSSNDLADGSVRVLISSVASKPFNNVDGEIFSISIAAADDMERGDYTVELSNIIFSDTNGNTYQSPDLSINLRVINLTPGDVNGDKNINVGDYVTTANYILQKDPQPFIFAAADIDGNNTINVGDLVGVANLALHYEGSKAKNNAPRSVGEILTLDAAMTSPSTITLNTTATAALQFDLTLPAGTSVAVAVAGSNHSAETVRLANGNWRVLVSSPNNSIICGDVTVTLEGKAEGDAVLHGIMGSDMAGTVTEFDDIVLPISTTGIAGILDDDNTDGTIYDMSGRRVVNPTPGIYIRNGKKIIVR